MRCPCASGGASVVSAWYQRGSATRTPTRRSGTKGDIKPSCGPPVGHEGDTGGTGDSGDTERHARMSSAQRLLTAGRRRSSEGCWSSGASSYRVICLAPLALSMALPVTPVHHDEAYRQCMESRRWGIIRDARAELPGRPKQEAHILAYGDDRLDGCLDDRVTANATAARGAHCGGYSAPGAIFPMRRASSPHRPEPSHHPLARDQTAPW